MSEHSSFHTRIIETVLGTSNVRSEDLSEFIYISEVSLRIRFLIPEAAFGVDFFILLGPNLKYIFIYVGNASV